MANLEDTWQINLYISRLRGDWTPSEGIQQAIHYEDLAEVRKRLALEKDFKLKVLGRQKKKKNVNAKLMTSSTYLTLNTL